MSNYYIEAISTLVPNAKFILTTSDLSDVEWLDNRERPSNSSIEEMAKALEDKAVLEAEKKERKWNTDYNGVSVSLTSKDAIALMQIQVAFERGETRTVFEFQNGTKMEMTPAIFQEFAPWFVAKRNEFFQ